MSRARACGRALIAAAAAALLATFAAAEDALEQLPTTTEFDFASRGKSKYGDSCTETIDCGFPGSVCHKLRGQCMCDSSLPATNHIDKCGRAVSVNESCFFNEQCQEMMERTECRNQRCACLYEMVVEVDAEGQAFCVARYEPPPEPSHIDPAMIGVLVGMALMFVIICVVLRLFSRARWRENRTIFNTPNPRLMNVSLLRDTKQVHAQDGRRGSRASMRPPSRQASQQELRSPVQEYLRLPEASRRGSRASSNMSASTRSSKSPTEKPPNNHHASHPAHLSHPSQITFESVTIEVQEVKA